MQVEAHVDGLGRSVKFELWVPSVLDQHKTAELRVRAPLTKVTDDHSLGGNLAIKGLVVLLARCVIICQEGDLGRNLNLQVIRSRFLSAQYEHSDVCRFVYNRVEAAHRHIFEIGGGDAYLPTREQLHRGGSSIDKLITGSLKTRHPLCAYRHQRMLDREKHLTGLNIFVCEKLKAVVRVDKARNRQSIVHCAFLTHKVEL